MFSKSILRSVVKAASETKGKKERDVYQSSILLWDSPGSDKRPHIVLDIDGTLVCGVNYETTLESLQKFHPCLPYFMENNLVAHALVYHFIHPGTIEFLQYLFDLGLRVSFFSAGSELRNETLVPKLLVRALGHKYHQIKDDVSIFSKHHLTDVSESEARYQKSFFNILSLGGYKKDLLKVVEQEESLRDTILIDDQSSYIAYGQEKNCLLVKGATLEMYDAAMNASALSRNTETLLAINHVFYMAGLLSKILDQNEGTLSERLFKLQYHEINMSYRQQTYLFEDKAIYDSGLQVLQKYNPSLRFHCEEQFQQCFTLNPLFII